MALRLMIYIKFNYMSHVKNVQAFGKLTGICTGYGGNYNPGQQNLQVNAMITLLNSAQQAMQDVNEAQTFYDNATNHRRLGFKGIRRFSSNVNNILKACGAHELTRNDVSSSVRKIWGVRRTQRKANAEIKPEEIKAGSSFIYGLNYASLANYFAQLVSTVSAEPKYRPNEPEYSVEGLKQKLAELHELNELVAQAEIRLATARRNRNELFYIREDSLFYTALAVKHYVRGVFGYKSAQHLETQRLHFSKPKL